MHFKRHYNIIPRVTRQQIITIDNQQHITLKFSLLKLQIIT